MSALLEAAAVSEQPALKKRKKTNKVAKVLVNHSVEHPSLCQSKHNHPDAAVPYKFVIGADPQFGMRNSNRDWAVEMEYSEKAVTFVNCMEQKPAFLCMCGDLVDMEAMTYAGKFGTTEECNAVQDQQYDDFERIYSRLDPEIPLLCLCGNHDVGNRPTPESIARFTDRFGDDYFAFWCHRAYHICLNTNLHNDPSGAPEHYEAQHQWLEERLVYAKTEQAERIFLFGHHPWFLYDEEEKLEEMLGENEIPFKDTYIGVPDRYFSIRLSIREKVLQLCKDYQVNACFAGHYHQNNISYTSWGMPMIVTGGICNYPLLSNAKDLSRPENQTPGAGVRIVEVSNAFITTPTANNQEGQEINSSLQDTEVSIKDDDRTDDGKGPTTSEKGDSTSEKEDVQRTKQHVLGFTHRYEVL